MHTTEGKDWLLGEARRKNGGSAIVRFLAERPHDSLDLSESVRVSWRFPESGVAEEVFAAMERFEELLQPLVESSSSRLAVVVTAADCREWIFYVSDAGRFGSALNGLLRDQPRLPIQLYHEADPSWTQWQRFSSLPRSEKRRANQPPRMPVSGTPAAGAPVAPPPGPAGR
jgi:hypothetical protein